MFMPFLPLPFVFTILLIVLSLSAATRDDEKPTNWPLQALILVSAFLSLLSGLRWGYGVRGAIMYLAPNAATAVPPRAYAGVMELVRRPNARLLRHFTPHAAPIVAVIVLLETWHDAVDTEIVVSFVADAVAILRLIRPGADALRLTPFERTMPAYRAILFAALALLFSAGIDTFAFLDVTWMQRGHSPSVIAIGNLLSLIILSLAVASANRSRAETESAETKAAPQIGEDKETFSIVETVMATKHVYRDVDLSLDRLARKLGIPARQISSAINRATGRNVSQYVNEHRVTEACIC